MDKALIVDDDKVVAKIVSRSLKVKLGVESTIAYSMAEAKALIESGRENYWVAVLDYNLPDAPEGEIVDFVLGKNIPSIVLTGMYSPDIRDSMASKNIVDYIVKRSTRDLDHMVSVVRRVDKNRKLKALVVDDSKLFRDHIASILKNQLLTVFSASGAKEALAIIDRNPDIRLVISDYQMPDMDGMELLIQIRKHHKKENMSIIIASGMAGNDTVPKFLKAGANDYIQKPYNVEELVCRVNLNLEHIQMVESLRDFAQRDPMTGLCNRRYLFEAGSAVHATAARTNLSLAMFMFDLDHFKEINDTYGHAAGDAVIKNFAGILSESFHRKNDIVARIGGEEFCALSVYEDYDHLLPFAERIRRQVEDNPVIHEDQTIHYTCSIGICPDITPNLDELLRLADEQLYMAKNSGRNRTSIP